MDRTRSRFSHSSNSSEDSTPTSPKNQPATTLSRLTSQKTFSPLFNKAQLQELLSKDPNLNHQFHSPSNSFSKIFPNMFPPSPPDNLLGIESKLMSTEEIQENESEDQISGNEGSPANYPNQFLRRKSTIVALEEEEEQMESLMKKCRVAFRRFQNLFEVNIEIVFFFLFFFFRQNFEIIL